MIEAAQAEFAVANAGEIPSPALLIYWERVEQNLATMLQMVNGDAARLRPHIKTHKLPQLVRRQGELGIHKVKCATLAEAHMAAEAGAWDVLLAMPLVGPAVAIFLRLQRAFPHVHFSTLVDDLEAATALGKAAAWDGQQVEVFLDLDVGQGRTGFPAGPQAGEVYRRLEQMPGLKLGGLHAYDGHLSQTDLQERAAACAAALAPVYALQQELRAPKLIVGGTPTFPIHAQNPAVECSPGTCVFWDAGYSTKVPDLPFVPAAALLTRVVSRPGVGRICVDLGHKAVASEMLPPRAVFPALPEAKAVMHSEEHLVLETPAAAQLPVGTVLYALPWHVCPTIALHAEVVVVKGSLAQERWPVVARSRQVPI